MYFNQTTVTIFEESDITSQGVSQGVYGQGADILGKGKDDFLKIKMCDDGYEGFVQKQYLNHSKNNPTHYVHNKLSLLFSKPDIKSPSPIYLPFGAVLRQEKIIDHKFMACENGYALIDHLSPLGEIFSSDYVKTAQILLTETPYLWGGRSVLGIDCSGLVQMALRAAGYKVPRDSKDQQDFLPINIPIHSTRQRGDIIFWKGHVGLMIDVDNIIHANAHFMSCIIEPLMDVIARADGPIIAVKRVHENIIP